jgi:aminoglycoside phosphotransferase (APT) family kinase protein
MDFSAAAHEWLGQAIGRPEATLTIERMEGSTSSSVFLVWDRSGQVTRRFVLRVLDNSAWLAEEPDLAAHEAAALEEAQRAGLAAPELVAYADGEAGFGAPVVLMSWLQGRIDLRPARRPPWLKELAGQLAAIHRHPAAEFPWRYRSWVDAAALLAPPWTDQPQLWEEAFALWREPAPDSPTVFIHRDYHPANVLWRQSAISGVVDWINACRGPAGVDVGHCRINLALMYGPDVADQFLASYQAAAPAFPYHPYWDIDTILDMALPEPDFYAPWSDFGLARIAPDQLRQRIEGYLQRVLRRPTGGR